MLEGIDISRANGLSIDWPTVAQHIQFVYVKSSDGVDYEDPLYASDVKSIKARNLDFGAYHYLRVRHGRAQDAEKQAQQFCGLFLREGCTIRPTIDCELSNNEAATGAEWSEAIKVFARCVEMRLGVKPFIYTYPAFWTSHKELCTDEFWKDYPLWIAHYTLSRPWIPEPWQGWSAWQYAAGAGVHGHVPGIKGDVDQDRFDGTIEELRMPPPKSSNPEDIYGP